MHGPELLKGFLANRKISRQRAATEMGVSTTALHYWLHGSQPRQEQRERIERYTAGEVPASAWTKPEDEAAIAAVKPAESAPSLPASADAAPSTPALPDDAA